MADSCADQGIGVGADAAGDGGMRCWRCAKPYEGPDDYGPEAEWTCAACWKRPDIDDVDFVTAPARFDFFRPVVACIAFLFVVCVPISVVTALVGGAAMTLVSGCISTGGAGKAAKDAGGSFLGSLLGTGNAPSYAFVGLLAAFWLIVATATAFASIWVPLIPRKAAVAALLMSVGLFALHRLLAQYLGLLVLLVVIGGIVAVAPLVYGWAKRNAQKYGERLAKTDPRGGVAIAAWGNPKVNQIRKAALTRYEAMARTAPKQEGT